MRTQLIVAEKPIAAERIATFLSEHYDYGLERKEFSHGKVSVDYYVLDSKEQPIYVVALAGHLVQPEMVRKGKYPKFKWEIRGATRGRRRARWELVKQLSEDTELIGATDNDDEGEVMLMYIGRALELEPKKFPRMRFVELTPSAVVKAYERATSGDEFLNISMALAGHIRHLLDLWYGKNVSHLFSEGAVRQGAPPQIRFWLGRVKIPMLKYLSRKRVEILEGLVEKELGQEKKETTDKAKYYTDLHLDFYGDIKVDSIECTPDELKEVLDDEWAAEVTGVWDGEGEEEPTRKIYDTDAITSSASSYGIPTTKVRNILQFLYVTGLISYPRTSSTKLKEDMDVGIINSLAEKFDWIDVEDFDDFSELTELHEDETSPHVGIYPTGKIPTYALPDEHLILWELVVRKFLSALGKAAKIEKRGVDITVYRNGEEHTTTERVFEETVYWGYKKYGRGSWSTRTTYKLPEVEEGEDVKVWFSLAYVKPNCGERERFDLETKVPRINKTPLTGWSGLLSWMDRNMLGTEATRSGHVEDVLSRGYASGEEEVSLTAIGQRVAALCKEYINITVDDTMELRRMVGDIREGETHFEDVLEQGKEKIITMYEDVNIDELGEELNNVGVCPVCESKARLVFFSDKYFVGCTRYPECKFLLLLS